MNDIKFGHIELRIHLYVLCHDTTNITEHRIRVNAFYIKDLRQQKIKGKRLTDEIQFDAHSVIPFSKKKIQYHFPEN